MARRAEGGGFVVAPLAFTLPPVPHKVRKVVSASSYGYVKRSTHVGQNAMQCRAE